MLKWKLKSNLDEMQEQKLLKIEHRTLWPLYFGLFLCIMVQQALGARPSQWMGEWVLFMAASVWLSICCARSGIWDRYLKPNLKTNLLASLIGGGVVGLFCAVTLHLQIDDMPVWLLAVFSLTSALATFLLCLAALTIVMGITLRRRRQLDQEEPSES